MFQNVVHALNGGRHDCAESQKLIRGTVVLMKKNVLDFNDFTASFMDHLDEFVGNGVAFQLISAVHTASGNVNNLFTF
ncbi:hypothetical protein L6164_035032 [Bauhinia variegata]|uniref:Uncharacterized protein n=1 Tax=Bauhinia variegata TaxID=167791 RepID=A0ACB9KWW8_BAUVA|nr:hypothetical protein L6164_035032 [Bauhinia variegata]